MNHATTRFGGSSAETRTGAARFALSCPSRATAAAVGLIAGRGGLCAGWVFLLLVAIAAPARAQFSAHPAILEFAGGDTVDTGVIQVTNDGDRPLQIRVYAADFDQAESGDHVFPVLGEHPRSCAERVAAFPDGLTIQPGERRDVRVRMAPGPSTCWSVVFLENPVPTTGDIRIAQRIGIKVYGVAAGAVRDGEITALSVVADSAGPAAALEFRNIGSSPLRPVGRVEIRSLDGAVVRTVAIDPFSVLPDHRRRVSVHLGRTLDPGRYLIVPILDIGADFLVGGQAVYAVP